MLKKTTMEDIKKSIKQNFNKLYEQESLQLFESQYTVHFNIQNNLMFKNEKISWKNIILDTLDIPFTIKEENRTVNFSTRISVVNGFLRLQIWTPGNISFGSTEKEDGEKINKEI